jgi:acyl-CoA thioesterase I
VALTLFFTMLLPVPAALAQAQGKPPSVLILGDSLSAEYGLPRGTGWVALLERRIVQEKLPHKVINASISGETTSGGAQRIETLIKQHAPTVVVIELGGNDALRGLALEASQNNLARMIETAKKTKTGVLLVGMEVPPNYGTAYTQRFRGMFTALASKYQVPLVPFLLEKFGTDLSYFQPDRIHPNERGQPLMLETVWPRLQPLLRATRGA